MRVGGVQPVDVGEQDEQLRLGQLGDDGREGVVFPDGVVYADLVGDHGVVFVDDGDGLELKQTQEGIAHVLPPPLVPHVGPGQQHLGHRMVVLGEQLVVDVHQFALSYRRGGLFGGHVGGTARQLELAHPHADGPRGHQDDFMPRVFQIGQGFA